MPKRSSKPSEDPNVTAHRVVQEATREADAQVPEPQPSKEKRRNPAAVALGRLGGKKGGKARAEKLSPERRREIARKAAEARWGTVRSGSGHKGR